MALFGKKNTETNIPELQEYYANQKRESTGLAWLLAVGSLLITAAVIIGLFVGGRWAYRKIAKKDKTTTVATVQTTTQTTSPTSTTSTTTTPTTTPTPVTTTPTPTATTPSTSTTTSTPSATTTTSTTSTPAQGVSTTQTTATNTSAVAATTNIPNTGAGNTIGLFTILTIGAYLAHRAFTVRKLSR
jgi:cytoskeletal protein RodZ